MKLWPFVFLLLGISVQAAPQLNVLDFASCLGQQAPQINLPALQSQYHFGDLDLLIFYLAAYPGEKLPGVPASLQAKANQSWGVQFEAQGAALAQSFLSSPPRTPQDAYKSALIVCGQDPFCATLTIQNVLRTFGRYGDSVSAETDDNPDWFKNNSAQWIAAIPVIQASMISLRTDGGGDRFGEWYHVFGILSYAIDEKALGHSESSVEKIVDLNNLLDKRLTGNDEDPVKAQIDQDAVVMSWDYLGGKTAGVVDCSSADAYVISGS